MKMKKYLIVIIGFVLLLLSYGVYHYISIVRSQDEIIEIITTVDDVDVEQADVLEEVLEELTEALPEVSVEQTPVIVEPSAQVEHLFQPLSKTIFITPEERRDFFDQLGIEYCNETIIDYLPLLEQDFKTSEKYLSDQQENDLLTEFYGDHIVAKTLMPMSIRWLGEQVGHGVFAEEDLPEWGFVGVYGGVAKDRELVGNKDYAWAYPAQTVEGGRITLDARTKGNELRLVNDGKDPNCIVKYVLGYDGLWHVCYIALKNIKKGDQLLVSYGPAYWDTRKYAYHEFADVQ